MTRDLAKLLVASTLENSANETTSSRRQLFTGVPRLN